MNTTQLDLRSVAQITSAGGPAAASNFQFLTSEDLLAYCTIRLKAADTNISAAMQHQDTKVKEQKMLQGLLDAVNRFSPNGPKDASDWQQIQDAFDAMTQNPGGLPANDPTVVEAGKLLDSMKREGHNVPDLGGAQASFNDADAKYQGYVKYCADHPTDEGAKNQLTFAKQNRDAADAALTAAREANADPDHAPVQAFESGRWDSVAKLPLDGLMTTTKGAAELDMLNLQSMVSQRQTIIQLVTGMMSKFDQTLEAAASKVGT